MNITNTNKIIMIPVVLTNLCIHLINLGEAITTQQTLDIVLIADLKQLSHVFYILSSQVWTVRESLHHVDSTR